MNVSISPALSGVSTLTSTLTLGLRTHDISYVVLLLLLWCPSWSLQRAVNMRQYVSMAIIALRSFLALGRRNFVCVPSQAVESRSCM